ncbi:MAG: nuclear transport factor 2 family protein [Nostocoides sp.]
MPTETSVRHLLDLRAIEQLKYDYCWAYDTADIDTLVDLFTTDAVCELGAFGTFTGTDAIRAGYASIMANTGIPGSRRHLPGNPQIDISGDRANGRWYLLDLRTEQGAAQPVRIVATYADTYARVGEVWRIARTSLTIEWLEPDWPRP